ncbi:MAG: alpha/beta hydrolase, partial [Actinomyces sp.]
MGDPAFAPAPADTAPYDEFALVAENAAEMGVVWPPRHRPRRLAVRRGCGQTVSLIAWGEEPPELVLLHGAGQNAHTWDSVLVALDRPAVAIDLPGHGHSDRRADRDYGPWANAEAVAEVLDRIGARQVMLVGMSLGGATALRLAAERPDLVRRVLVIDVSPAINEAGRAMTPEQRGSVALLSGPPTYDSYEQIVETTLAMSPRRTEAGIRRGVRHNTVRRADGRWAWRYDLFGPETDGPETGGPEADGAETGGPDATSGDAPDAGEETGEAGAPRPSWLDFSPLWDDVERLTVPLTVVVGGDSVYVRPEDLEEYRRRRPDVTVETV